MSPTPDVQPIEGFSAIGPGIYLRQSREQCQPEDTSPNVILIFGWMGAQPRHLQNYTRAYTKLYPNASQVVVQCNPNIFWSTMSSKKKRLLPIIDVLEALHCFPSSSLPQKYPRILTHTFSNGGSLQMMLLGQILQQKYGSASVRKLFASALIFDSCPGVGGLKVIRLAFSAVVKNPILRYTVLAFLYTMQFIHWSLSLLFGKRMMIMENLRVELWNPRILPWMGLHTPRLYLFSRNDKLIRWQDVTHHADTAKERGMDVHCELFEESEHVAHIRVEPERYWSSVQKVWEVAVAKEKGEDSKKICD